MADPRLTDPLTAEVRAFQQQVTAPTAFSAVADILPDAGNKAAIYADAQNERSRKPLSFKALKEFCASFDLRQFGISRDSIVCTAMPNGAEAAVCFWAISEHCVFAPLNPALTVPEVEFELEDLPCHTMILMEGDTMSSIAGIEEACKQRKVNVLRLVPDLRTVGLFTLRGTGSPAPASPVNSSDLALVLHTSGTTKKPKIVPLTHHNLGNGIQFVANTLQRQPTDLCLNVMPLFHIHGLIANVGASLYSQSPVVASAFMGGEDFLTKVKQSNRRPSWYSAVPTMHEAILLEAEKQGKALDHSLKLMRNCSAALLPPVSKRFLKAFGDDLGKPFTVVPTYAMTESFPICSNPPSLEIRLSTVGPAMGPNIKILAGHPEDAELPIGTEGEVCVTGACVTSGYLMRDHMSQDPNIEAFSLPTSSVGRMLRTGDKGYIDSSGYLQLVGRFKEIINCGGEKISPLDMEEQLLRVPGVETCVCFASPADLLGEVVGVACVPKADHPYPSLKEMRDGLPGTAPRFKPRVLVIMDAIPKGPTGKPKRIGLAKMLNIPAVDQIEDVTYRVEGKGDDLGDLMRLTEKGEKAPVWYYPLTMSLDISPDLGDEQRTMHTLVIEDSLWMDYSLTITCWKFGAPLTIDGSISKEYVKEAIAYMNMHTEERGLKWVAKCGERGRFEDWCGEVTMDDGTKKLSHYWPNGCSDTPPGKLMRLLQVLEYASGAEHGPDVDGSIWHKKWEEHTRGTASPPTGAA